MLRRAFFFATFLFVISAGQVIACSCAESPMVNDAFDGAKSVVIMKAVSRLASLPADKKYNDASVPGFNFVVQKVYKGILKAGQEIPVVSSGMCSFGFDHSDLGREYLFYYYDSDNFSMVPMCTRSAAIEWAAADLLYIEKADRVRDQTRISGTVYRKGRNVVEGDNNRSLPLSKRVIWVRGQGRNLRVETDENGVYEVYGLPPGTYRVEPQALSGYIPTNEINTRTDALTVTIRNSGHAEANFYFEAHNSISGVLLDADGSPLEGLRLDLLPSRGRPAKYFVETAYPKRDGTFKFTNVPPGTYVIVGNPDNKITAEMPYPRFYSSGADDRASAEEITAAAGSVSKGIVIRASRPVRTVVIEGQLLYDDGTPASDGTIKFVVNKTGEPRSTDDAVAYPDKNGNFRLTALEGKRGWLYGYVYPNEWRYRACKPLLEQVKRAAAKDSEGFLLTERQPIESTTTRSGVQLKFPFSLCSSK